IRLALIFLPGAVVGAVVGHDFFSGFLVWVGSLVGGTVSLLFTFYIPEKDRPLHAAEVVLHEASVDGDKQAVLGFIDSPYQGVRLHAVIKIRRSDWREFTPDLVRRLGVEEDAEVRSALVLALAEWADPATEATLLESADDSDRDVRRLGLRGLSRLGNPAVVPAAKAMYETSGYQDRIEAVGALLRLGTPEAEAMLNDLMANEQSWRRRRQARGARRRFRKQQACGKSWGV
ncbi:MAG TPA: HEAT repeat domain-containing protein, partial [Granulicella sp.]|nr:HEAT repeat domain-containing protein [Granulicella sp.]